MSGKPDDIRVMLVDDSAVIRGLTARWLGETPGVKVVAVHANGRVAVEDVEASKPDVVVLDIEMPEMDGLTALPLLLQRRPGVMVLVSSTLSRQGAETSLRCLTLGAAHCIAKPGGSGRIASADDYRRELVDLVLQLGSKAARRHSRPASSSSPSSYTSSTAARAPGRAATSEPAKAEISPRVTTFMERLREIKPATSPSPSHNGPALRPFSRVPPRVLALGSSTGGPQALVQVLKTCKDMLVRVPVLITQHMPPTFTALLAEQLGRATGLPAAEGQDGEEIVAGRIYVAPGGLHLIVEKDDRAVVTRLRDTPPEHFCRPAVDPMFRSVAQVFGAASLGVVLTGMGNDGGLGASAISNCGGSILIQDEETSVVWGMPGAVRAAGAAAAVLPLDRIGVKIAELLREAGR